MIEGINVNLGGREFVAPPIPLKIFRTKAAWFEELNKMQRTQMMTPAAAEAVVGIIHAALVRNYPDLTVEEVEDLLDLRSMTETVTAIMDFSGAVKVNQGEAAAPGAPASPGVTSTP